MSATSWIGVSADSLVSPRLPSALAGSVFLTAIVWQWGLIGFVVAGLLFHEPYLILHSTEARPYTLWLLLNYIYLIFFHKAFFSSLEEQTPAQRRLNLCFFSLSAILLAFVASGSLFLLLGTLLWVVFFQSKRIWDGGLALAPALLILAYYLVVPTIDCTNFPGKNGIHSLAGTIPHGDYILIKGVIRLVFSKPLVDLPIYLAGIFGLFLAWRKNLSPQKNEKKELFSLLVIFGFALFSTAAAIAYKNYYFVPRLFLFVLAGKAVFLCITLNILSEAAQSKFKYKNHILFVIMGALAVYPFITIFLELKR